MSFLNQIKINQDTSAISNSHEASKTPKLLVIDDEPFNLEILTDYLSEVGFYCECFDNPIAGWLH